MVVEDGSQMAPSSDCKDLPNVAIFSIFTGYQMAISVVTFSVFNIVTRDVPYVL